MADLSITAASVLPSDQATILQANVSAGVTITAGQTVYLHTDGTLRLAYNAGTLLEGTVVGISLNGGGPGQKIRYVAEDPALVLGCTMTVGDVIYLGGVAGGMTLTTVDLDTGEFCSVLGICSVVNSTINMKIIRSGAARTTNQV